MLAEEGAGGRRAADRLAHRTVSPQTAMMAYSLSLFPQASWGLFGQH